MRHGKKCVKHVVMSSVFHIAIDLTEIYVNLHFAQQFGEILFLESQIFMSPSFQHCELMHPAILRVHSANRMKLEIKTFSITQRSIESDKLC